MSDAALVTYRRTRKRRHCYCCGRAIPAGTMYARVFFTAAGLYDESHVACEDLIGEVMTLCGMEDESLGCWNPMASRHDAEEAMETLRHDASGANRWAHSPRRAADALAKLKAHWQFLDETEDGR